MQAKEKMKRLKTMDGDNGQRKRYGRMSMERRIDQIEWCTSLCRHYIQKSKK